MREPQQTLQADEEVTLVVSGEEATLVAPRFDDEETLVARPVVPLDAEPSAPPVETSAASPLPAYAPRPYAARRSLVLALVLVSVLVGGVLGGAGLYLYQRQSQGDGTAAASNPQPAAETQQPAPTPTVEAAAAPQPEAPAADTEADAGEVTELPLVEASDDVEADDDARDAREPESAPVAERRDGADAGGGSAGPRKRGKKGEHDAEAVRPERVRPRADAPVARDDSAPREARRVDSIFYRPRRAERRAARRARREAAADTDRLRRIFEGTPE